MSVALIAGEGTLPEEIARRMAGNGCKPIVYALRENCDGLVGSASEILPVWRMELSATLKDMAARGVKKVLFAGLVPKTLMYRSAMME